MRRSLLTIAFFISACARAGTSAPCAPASAANTTLAAANSTSPSSPSRPAHPSDVGSVDQILAALYGSVSGPPGPRDWDRVRSLFAPGAFVAPVEHRPDGRASARIMTIEAFIERSSRNVRSEGFYEKEVARRSDAFGSIVHVFSTYEARHSADDPRPFRRGINSIQLLNDGERYWVVSIYWDTEREGVPLPEQYLPAR